MDNTIGVQVIQCFYLKWGHMLKPWRQPKKGSELVWCIRNRRMVESYELLSNCLNFFFWKAFIILKHLKQFSLKQQLRNKFSQPKYIETNHWWGSTPYKTKFLCTWANSVTTQNSWGVSKASIISIIFSCLSFLRIYKNFDGSKTVRWYSEIRNTTHKTICELV